MWRVDNVLHSASGTHWKKLIWVQVKEAHKIVFGWQCGSVFNMIRLKFEGYHTIVSSFDFRIQINTVQSIKNLALHHFSNGLQHCKENDTYLWEQDFRFHIFLSASPPIQRRQPLPLLWTPLWSQNQQSLYTLLVHQTPLTQVFKIYLSFPSTNPIFVFPWCLISLAALWMIFSRKQMQ